MDIIWYLYSNYNCINYNPSVSMIYTSIEKDKFIYTCRGHNNDYNLYQFNSDFELEVRVNNKKFIVVNNNIKRQLILLTRSLINGKRKKEMKWTWKTMLKKTT